MPGIKKIKKIKKHGRCFLIFFNFFNSGHSKKIKKIKKTPVPKLAGQGPDSRPFYFWRDFCEDSGLPWVGLGGGGRPGRQAGPQAPFANRAPLFLKGFLRGFWLALGGVGGAARAAGRPLSRTGRPGRQAGRAPRKNPSKNKVNFLAGPGRVVWEPVFF